MIKTAKDLQILAEWIFDNNIKHIYINNVEAAADDYISLLERLKAGQEQLTGFVKTNSKLYLATA